MRNLRVLKSCYKKLFKNDDEDLCVSFDHHEDFRKANFYVCTTGLVISNIYVNKEVLWAIDISDTVSPNNKVVDLSFMSLVNILCVGLTNGELLTIKKNGSECEVVGVVENGILAMKWSPDHEQLVMITCDLKVITMSCAFDPVTETYLMSDEFGLKQFITVGWGKKETQFHGSAGKQAAKDNTDIIPESGIHMSDRILISWRGDSSVFAIGFMMEGLRRFKIFSKEGKLQYTSEKLQGLEANLAWRPSGNYIATTQKIGDKHMVSFFEKNGLKHREFVLPINSDSIVESLLWSHDSEILTVICYDSSENVYKILLFTTSNYVWYLKQTLIIKENISKIVWDNDYDSAHHKTLHIILQNGDYLSYSWIWSIDHSTGKSSSDDAVVTVIDGQKLLISSFRNSVVPPPMSSFEIEMGSDIQSVHFATLGCPDSNSLVVITEKSLVFLEQAKKKPIQYKITDKVPIIKNEFPFQYYNWVWLDEKTFLCAKACCEYYGIEQYEISDGTLTQTSMDTLPSAILSIVSHPIDPTKVFFFLLSGEVMEYCRNGAYKIQKFKFPKCIRFCIVTVEDELYFFGLTHNGDFYLNGEVAVRQVNSFFVQTGYLLITSTKHLFYCVELTKQGMTNISNYEETETPDIYKRKIERGAKLVISVPKDTRTVFQMPRGNLETIQPRPLSLQIIGEYLDELKYYEAFDLIRKQRINLNLIHDHDPELFLENINTFLDNISNSWLSLFLSEIENVDVTQTMYSSIYNMERDTSDKLFQNKIQHISDLVCEYISNAPDCAEKVLPLLTTLVKKNTTTDLEKALILIKEIKREESCGSKLPVTSDEALKYMLYMVNVDQLFNVALGMYDFDLVLLVANKSQKDPKEYIPMLNELNEMDENYKKFTINKHLKRFERAVQNLAECGESKYDELKTFVKYHSLYKEALCLLSMEDDIYKQISDDFGMYLKLKKQFVEAGIIYEKAKSYEKAIECYKDALEWELVMKLSHNRPKEELNKLVWELADRLKEEKRYKEAVVLLEQYSEDSTNIILFAIEGKQFKTAMRLCQKYNNPNFIETKLLPSLLEEYKSLMDFIETNSKNFTKYRHRLKVVRAIKIKKALEVYETHYPYQDHDLYSDAGSTIASSGSGRSYRSSKNKRKHERKVASLKEGSPYEDIALVLALHSIVTLSFELRQQVKDINIVLSNFNRDDEALSLETSLDELLDMMKDNLKQIWSSNFTLEMTSASVAAETMPDSVSAIPQGIINLEPHLRIAPIITELNWKLDGLSS